MRKVNLAEFSDLLSHALSVGYDWNQAHEILDKDSIAPEAECYTKDIDASCFEDEYFDWSEDTIKIIRTFMAVNNITEFTLTR